MKVAVSGSRSLGEGPFKELSAALYAIHRDVGVDAILHGNCRGSPDMDAQGWAEKNDIPVEKFRPKWDEHGKAAGPIRNRKMIEEVDFLVAVWDGKSRGTESAIEAAKSAGIPHHIIRP